MSKRSLAPLVSLLLLVGCNERIVEYREGVNPNDAFHGDIVGRVAQHNSGAVVRVSQVWPIQSTPINPMDGSFAFRDLRLGNYDLTIEAPDYRIYTRNNVMVHGGGVTSIGEIDLSTVPDLVAEHYPENKGEIVHDWRHGRIAISILFARPMDRVSVEEAFSTEPPSEGIFVWGQYTKAPLRTTFPTDPEGAFEPGATITTFSKITSMTYSVSKKDSHVDTTYTVTMSTAARDTAGNHLRFPLEFSFRTVQSYVTIYGIQTNPIHGDVDVDPLYTRSIRLTFPRRMDPSSTEAATTVTPPMNVVFLWPEGNVMLIHTGGPLLADELITVGVAGSALDRDGIPMGEDYSFSFRTAPFRVRWTSPSNAQVFVEQSLPITIGFNSYVVLSTMSGAFSITPAIQGTFRHGGRTYDAPEQIVFTPSTPYQPNTKYTVTISTAVEDLHGTRMKDPHTFSFVTRAN
ncbi:MAG: Ig-like domain-containing protein [Candidatus Latescibacterota bacterium]|nr:MAG: Ig-like domain-containing protein [Candidatus Latescibacterota bacterium]